MQENSGVITKIQNNNGAKPDFGVRKNVTYSFYQRPTIPLKLECESKKQEIQEKIHDSMLQIDSMSLVKWLTSTISIVIVFASTCLINCLFNTVIANIVTAIWKDHDQKFDLIYSYYIVIHAAATVLAVLIFGFNLLTLPI